MYFFVQIIHFKIIEVITWEKFHKRFRLYYFCVCVYIYTHVCVSHVGCAHVKACIGLHTHIQARIHVYACMCALPTAA